MSFEAEPIAKKQFNQDMYNIEIEKLEQLLKEANQEWLTCYQSNISDEEAWQKVLSLSHKLDTAMLYYNNIDNSNIAHKTFINSLQLKPLEEYLE
jgi:hypothetical protein